jgi:NADPH-dependent glutamate synthase beta subunit-like oxidoreductase
MLEDIVLSLGQEPLNTDSDIRIMISMCQDARTINALSHYHAKRDQQSLRSTTLLVIGAGPAGLAPALSLARQPHTVIIFDP